VAGERGTGRGVWQVLQLLMICVSESGLNEYGPRSGSFHFKFGFKLQSMEQNTGQPNKCNPFLF